MNSHSAPRSVCVICGSAKNIEHNHAGGRNHIAWFTVPFCERHHHQFHSLLESVGIDLRNTSNNRKRLVIAALALTIALWMVLQALLEAVHIPEKNT